MVFDWGIKLLKDNLKCLLIIFLSRLNIYWCVRTVFLHSLNILNQLLRCYFMYSIHKVESMFLYFYSARRYLSLFKTVITFTHRENIFYG